MPIPELYRDLLSKPALVVGSARSGQAAASLLREKSVEVFVTDSGPISEKGKALFDSIGVRWEEQGHTEKSSECDWMVLSPGVPTSAPIVQQYLADKKPVVSEIEMASWFLKDHQRIIAVTGTNGKTTVTNWLADVWKRSGRTFSAGGNLGTPFSWMIQHQGDVDDMILEVSSFQLDHIHFFRPNVSVILNITPDHMDRYQNSFELYAASKERIAMNQTHDDVFVYNADDAHCTAIARRLTERENAPSLAPFSLTTPLNEGGWIDHHTLTIHLNQKDEIQMPIQALALPGLHNTGNGLATAITALISGIKSDTIKEALSQFEGVEHRLEMVRELDGVRYINDSKATNVNAVWYALDSFQMPITLIMGGRDKGNDYTELESQLRSKVRAIVMIGEAAPKIEAQLSGVVPDLMKANSMAEAVRMARKMAKRGEIVLLSPACSSFDMFENYEQRGEVFKREVLSL